MFVVSKKKEKSFNSRSHKNLCKKISSIRRRHLGIPIHNKNANFLGKHPMNIHLGSVIFVVSVKTLSFILQKDQSV